MKSFSGEKLYSRERFLPIRLERHVDCEISFEQKHQNHGHIGQCTDLWQCSLMATLQCCPSGKPCHQHCDLISHSVTLSCHWANQSLPYPNNVDHLARKQQASIFIGHWFDSTMGLNSRSSACETSALVIRPLRLVLAVQYWPAVQIINKVIVDYLWRGEEWYNTSSYSLAIETLR